MPEHSASCMPHHGRLAGNLGFENNRHSSTTRDGYFFSFMAKIMETTKVTALIVSPMLVKTRANDSEIVMSPPPFSGNGQTVLMQLYLYFITNRTFVLLFPLKTFKNQKKPSLSDGFPFFSLICVPAGAIRIPQNRGQSMYADAHLSLGRSEFFHRPARTGH